MDQRVDELRNNRKEVVTGGRCARRIEITYRRNQWLGINPGSVASGGDVEWQSPEMDAGTFSSSRSAHRCEAFPIFQILLRFFLPIFCVERDSVGVFQDVDLYASLSEQVFVA